MLINSSPDAFLSLLYSDKIEFFCHLIVTLKKYYVAPIMTVHKKIRITPNTYFLLVLHIKFFNNT